jgi:hypothetical protein
MLPHEKHVQIARPTNIEYRRFVRGGCLELHWRIQGQHESTDGGNDRNEIDVLETLGVQSERSNARCRCGTMRMSVKSGVRDTDMIKPLC